jgi:hypothetical protein
VCVCVCVRCVSFEKSVLLFSRGERGDRENSDDVVYNNGGGGRCRTVITGGNRMLRKLKK